MDDLHDISTASYGYRTRRFLKDNYGMTGASPGLTMNELNGARESATEEMLDEIHCMLRILVSEKTGHEFYVPISER